MKWSSKTPHFYNINILQFAKYQYFNSKIKVDNSIKKRLFFCLFWGFPFVTLFVFFVFHFNVYKPNKYTITIYITAT